MHKRLKSVILFGTLLLVPVLLAAPASAAIEGGDARKGKQLAIEKCKGCHTTGANGGTMTPLSRTQLQWQRFYVKDRHNKLAPGAFDKISASELLDIMQFMYDHAADSPRPETCGQ